MLENHLAPLARRVQYTSPLTEGHEATVASPPQNSSLPLYQVVSARPQGEARGVSGDLAHVLARCRAKDPDFAFTKRGGDYRIWALTPSDLERRVAEVTAAASFAVEAGPPTVAPAWTPGRVAEAEHRLGSAESGAGAFAVVRLRIVPRRSGEGNIFETEFAGPPQIDAFNEAVARGVAIACDEGVEGEGRIIDTGTVFIDGSFHATRSTPAGFEQAATAAMRAACAAAAMRRLEPLVAIDIQVGRDHVLPVVNDLATSGGSEIRRRLAPSGVIVAIELPMRSFLVYGERLASLTNGAGRLIGEPKLTRWAEVRRTHRG
jgi:translation elongation factor EF-G